MLSSATPSDAEQLMWSHGQLVFPFCMDCGFKSILLEKQLPPVALKALRGWWPFLLQTGDPMGQYWRTGNSFLPSGPLETSAER